VFYSVTLLDQPWRGLTKADPILYMVTASRHGMLGTSEIDLWISLTVTAGLTAMMVAWAGWLVARGTGLRT
jgi:ABC-2 type transport system permease protein